MSKIAGTAFIKVDGVSYSTSVEDGWTITALGVKAEPIKDNFGRNHYTETPVIDEFDGSFLMTDGINPETVTKMRDVTVKLEFGNAKTCVLSNAMYTGDGTVSTKDGSFKVKFSGTAKWY